MWISLELLLLAVFVDSAKLSKKSPLVVYVQQDTRSSVENGKAPVEFNEDKLSMYQLVFQNLLGSMHIKKNEQLPVEKALRAAIGSRCARLANCRKSCRRNDANDKCKTECKTNIDEDDLCGDEKVEKPKSEECKFDEEKKEFNCSEEKEEDECANDEEATECSKRSFRANKDNKKRRFRSVN